MFGRINRFFREPLGEKGGVVSPALKWALIVGATVHIVGFLLFRVLSNPLPEAQSSEAFVVFLPESVLEEDVVLQEQASLFDTAPLFVPGEWSSERTDRISIQPRPEMLFSSFEPDIRVAEELRSSGFSRSKSMEVGTPQEFLELGIPEEFSTFGMVDSGAANEVEEWVPFARITSFLGPEDTKESVLDLGVAFWEQLNETFYETSILVVINKSEAGRMIGTPILSRSSGDATVDVLVLDWLRSPITFSRLPSGLVSVEVFL